MNRPPLPDSSRRLPATSLAAVLVLAAALQWLSGPAWNEPGALGMAAPAPSVWDAAKPGAPSAAASGSRLYHQGQPPRLLGGPEVAVWQLLPAPAVLDSHGRQRLLELGRLLLEGG